MFWLAGQLFGLLLAIAGVLLFAFTVVAVLFCAAMAIMLSTFVLAGLIDLLYSLFTWKWDNFAIVRGVDTFMENGAKSECSVPTRPDALPIARYKRWQTRG